MTVADLLNIATKFANKEDVVGAIFRKGKSPHDADVPCSERRDSREYLDRHWRKHRPARTKDREVTVADWPPRPPVKNDNDHF